MTTAREWKIQVPRRNAVSYIIVLTRMVIVCCFEGVVVSSLLFQHVGCCANMKLRKCTLMRRRLEIHQGGELVGAYMLTKVCVQAHAYYVCWINMLEEKYIFWRTASNWCFDLQESSFHPTSARHRKFCIRGITAVTDISTLGEQYALNFQAQNQVRYEEVQCVLQGCVHSRP